MLAKTMTAKQRLWLSHVKAADAADGSIADYAQNLLGQNLLGDSQQFLLLASLSVRLVIETDFTQN